MILLSFVSSAPYDFNVTSSLTPGEILINLHDNYGNNLWADKIDLNISFYNFFYGINNTNIVILNLTENQTIKINVLKNNFTMIQDYFYNPLESNNFENWYKKVLIWISDYYLYLIIGGILIFLIYAILVLILS